MLGKVGPRKVRRVMKRMGMNVQELPNVREVVLRTDEKEIVIIDPTVTKMTLGKKESIFQIAGGEVTEKAIEGGISEEDAQLVAQQASVSIEEARSALSMTGGDLAQAIILLKSRKS